MAGSTAPKSSYPSGVCPYCGGDKFKEDAEEYEEIYTEHILSDGTFIPGAVLSEDENGNPYMAPTRIPFYKPNVYPIVLQKNISVYGQFFGRFGC